MKRVLYFLLLIQLFVACESTSTAEGDGGSGSEIVGDVAYEEGDSTGRAFGPPVVNGKIFIFKTDYEANTSTKYEDYIPDARTNTNGNFIVGPKKPGKYLIEANDDYGKAAIQYVTVTGAEDTIDLNETMIVKPTTTLKYSIDSDLIIPGITCSYVVYLLGTRIYAKGNETNLLEAELTNIPYGTYSIKVVLTLNGLKHEKVYNNISFAPDVITEFTFDNIL